MQVIAQTDTLAGASNDQKRSFLSYCAKYNRHYQSTKEMDARFANFLRTKKMIDEAPPSTFQMKLNQFSDYSDEEK
jgi:hypothetical protein